MESTEEEIVLTSEQIKEALGDLERDIQEHTGVVSDLRDKRSKFRKNILDFRTQISSDRQTSEQLLDTFHEQRQKETKYEDLSKQDAKTHAKELEPGMLGLFDQYRALLAQLQKRAGEVVLNAQPGDEGLVTDIGTFKSKLAKLEQEAKEPPRDISKYATIAVEHMQMLHNAARDLFNNASWEDFSEGMNAIWSALKQAVKPLRDVLGLTSEVTYGSLKAEGDEVSISDEEDEVLDDDADDQNDEMESVELNPTAEANEEALSHDIIDVKIENFLGGLVGIRGQGSGVEAIEKVKQDSKQMQLDIKLLLAEVKAQDFPLTPIQHAALHEIRAEAGKMIASVTPSAFEKGWEELKKQSEAGVSSFKSAFKKLTGGDSEAENDDNVPKT